MNTKRPRDEGKGGVTPQGMEDGRRRGVIAVNDLVYTLEPDLSCVVTSTHKQHVFQQSSYDNGDNAICILNSGSDYIDPRESYLTFFLKSKTAGVLVNAPSWHKYQAAGMCMIETITVSSRSGDQLAHINGVNMNHCIVDPIKYDDEWWKTVGKAAGAGLIMRSGTPYYEICVPMYLLCPLFAYGRLLPAMVMSGLRIEITWAASTRAYTPLHNTAGAVAAAGPALEIVKPKFVLKSIQLTDSIQRAMNELSAVNGLEIVYADIERNEIGTTGLTSSNHFEVRKAVSRALCAYVRETRQLTPADEAKTDSFRSCYSHCVQYQWQLGSQYFPHQPIAAHSATDSYSMVTESFVQALIAFNKYCAKERQGALSLNGSLSPSDVRTSPAEPFAGIDTIHVVAGFDHEFKQDAWGNLPDYGAYHGHYPSYALGVHCIAVGLERSKLFNLAGVPINNSRILALDRIEDTSATTVVAGEGNNQARKYSMFLKYVKLARCFLNNVEVES